MCYYRTIFYLFIALLPIFTIVSCCKTCLIANSELSYLKTGDYKTWKNVTTITSNTKSAKILPENGGQVLSYSMNGVNIFSSPSNSQIYLGDSSLDVSMNTPLEINKSQYQIFKPDTILFSNTLLSSPCLKFIKKFNMNLNNGDLTVTQYFKNNANNEKLLLFDNKIMFKKGGFFIVPVNIISELSNSWVDLDKNKKITSSNYIKTYSDKLFIKTNDLQFKVGTDNISGWVAYVYQDLLFVAKFPRKGKLEYTDKLSLIIDLGNDNVCLNIPSPIKYLTPGSEYIFSQKWSIIKLDKTIKSFDDAFNIFKKLRVSLIINR